MPSIRRVTKTTLKMCLCPIKVKNNKLDFDPLVDRLYNCVPCGNCYECQESKRNGYEVRALFEYYYTLKIGGCVFYVTLTYNNECVPKLPDTDIMVGSKSDVQKFVKRMRKHSSVPFRYFIVSEYGSLHDRPHYHGLFFFDNQISKSDFKNLISKCWKFGFVSYGENSGLVIDVRPFCYVSKYVCKDVYFTKILRKSDVMKVLSNYNSMPLDFRRKYSLFPFHLSSQKFGLSMASVITDNDYVRGYIMQTDSTGLNRSIQIPLYILRYTLYDKYENKNGSISYKLNMRGQNVFVMKMYYQYDKLRTKYIDALNSARNPAIFNVCKHLNMIMNHSHFLSIVDRLIDEVGSLVSYKLLYHDIDYVPFTFESFSQDLEIFCKSVFDKHFIGFTRSEKFECPYADECKIIIEAVEDIISYHRYLKYCDDVSLYNRKQLHRSFTTGEKKLKYMMTFSEFKNNVSFYKKPREKCLTDIPDLSVTDLFQ